MFQITPGAARWEDLYRTLLRDLQADSIEVKSHRGSHVERLAASFTLIDPHDRCLLNESRMFPVYYAVGHWLWIMAGRYDLPSIEYYTPKAVQFSSDLRKLDGSYGWRLFGPGSNNQIFHIIELIKERGETRRAVATVYMPDIDSVREAVQGREDEVPCTVALQYLPRGGKLHAVTYMRSQNVVDILPYDIFILTLLHEFVASSLDMELGGYHHLAGSFHYYLKDKASLEAIVHDPTPAGPLMPSMPRGPHNDALKKVLDLEERIRVDATAALRVPGIREFNPRSHLEEAEDLPGFWSEIVKLLVGWAAFSLGNEKWLGRIYDSIAKPFDVYVERSFALISKAKGRALETYGKA